MGGYQIKYTSRKGVLKENNGNRKKKEDNRMIK